MHIYFGNLNSITNIFFSFKQSEYRFLFFTYTAVTFLILPIQHLTIFNQSINQFILIKRKIFTNNDDIFLKKHEFSGIQSLTHRRKHN